MAGLAICRVDVLGKHDPFTDDLSLLVDAAAELRFGPWQDLVGQCRLDLVQVPLKVLFGNLLDLFVFYLSNGIILV